MTRKTREAFQAAIAFTAGAIESVNEAMNDEGRESEALLSLLDANEAIEELRAAMTEDMNDPYEHDSAYGMNANI